MTDMPAHAMNLVKFMLKQTGPFDVLVFADGRNRASRLEIERETSKMRHASEFFVIFKPTARSVETDVLHRCRSDTCLTPGPTHGKLGTPTGLRKHHLLFDAHRHRFGLGFA